jgi:hypothetical protein
MASNDPSGPPSQQFSYRGITFTICGHADAGYAWTIHPASRSALPPLGGHVAGLSAFRRAHSGARMAIDAWLKQHPGDGEP